MRQPRHATAAQPGTLPAPDAGQLTTATAGQLGRNRDHGETAPADVRGTAPARRVVMTEVGPADDGATPGSAPAGADGRDHRREVPPERTGGPVIQEFQEAVHNLSHREREVLSHIARGDTYTATAHRMNVSPHTVDTYLRRIRAKTGARSRVHLLLLALSLTSHSRTDAVTAPGLPDPLTTPAADPRPGF